MTEEVSEVEEEQEVLEGVRYILDREPSGYRNLISVLQEIQDEFGFLPKQGMREIADRFNLSPANVYGVATFYNQFRFTPPGKCHIKVCMGTACHIKQGGLILDQWERRLEIEEGERTPDGEYSIERVACVGACVLAPVCIVDGEVVGDMSPTKVDGILLQHKMQKEQQERQAAKEQASGDESQEQVS
ncbi:MAG: NAD(P)H-dependent oxidoreductase subunit E [bacterium]